MVYDSASDHYVPISWKDAFEVVGAALRGLDDPNQASFLRPARQRGHLPVPADGP
jgi:hypothetical protein